MEASEGPDLLQTLLEILPQATEDRLIQTFLTTLNTTYSIQARLLETKEENANSAVEEIFSGTHSFGWIEFSGQFFALSAAAQNTLRAAVRLLALILENKRSAEARRAGESMDQERNILTYVMETSPAGILMMRPDGQITFKNWRASQLLHFHEQQVPITPRWTMMDIYGQPLPPEKQVFQRVVATQQAFDKATADLAQIRALIAATNERLGNYLILAPRAGVVLRQDGEVGEIADVGQILFRVGDPRPLQVTADVAEEDIPRVKIGQAVLLRTDAFKDRPLDGTVRDITPMGDTATKTFRIRIALPDDTPLHFGMSVEANIVTREAKDVLLAPNEAIVGGAVFAVDNGRIVRRPVETGIRGTRLTEVRSGLAEGDRIAVPANAAWRGGERVRVAP